MQTKRHLIRPARLSNLRQENYLLSARDELMKTIQIDVLSETVNCPVVQMPGRKYPGLVLQGDSLRNLLDSTEEICELCASAGGAELSEAASSLREKLAGFVAAYEQAMKDAGRELPYPKRS